MTANNVFKATTTVDGVVRSDPALNRILGERGIDTCCGGSLTLAGAAASHGVPLTELLEALAGAAPPGASLQCGAPLPAPERMKARPVSPNAPPAAGPPPGQPRYLKFLVASLLLALTFGFALGAALLATTTLAWNFLGGVPVTGVKLAHGYAQVFGFAALFVMGVAYHVVSRYSGTPLAAPRAAAASFWLQTGGVVLVVAGALTGAPLSTVASVAGSLALLLAAIAFATVVHRTLGASGTSPAHFGSFLRAGCVWLVVASGLTVPAAMGAGVALQPAVWEAGLWGFAGSWLFGMSLRILPVFMGLPPSQERSGPGLVILYQSAVVACVIVAVVEAWTPVPAGRVVAGSALATAVAMFVLRLGVLGPRQPSVADEAGYAKFIVTGYAWLLAAVLFGPAWSAAAALGGTGAPSLLLDFGRHAFTLGFLTQMIVGVAMRVVPVFTGRPLWSRRWCEATYYLLNAGVATRGLQVLVAQGGVVALWPYVSLSGVLGLAAFAAFAVNMLRTVRSPRAATQLAAPPQLAVRPTEAPQR